VRIDCCHLGYEQYILICGYKCFREHADFIFKREAEFFASSVSEGNTDRSEICCQDL
jgi:hypothetical protein